VVLAGGGAALDHAAAGGEDGIAVGLGMAQGAPGEVERRFGGTAAGEVVHGGAGVWRGPRRSRQGRANAPVLAGF
ncbi:MAG: hypothetical protein ACK56I_20095, partial [bacterium]